MAPKRFPKKSGDNYRRHREKQSQRAAANLPAIPMERRHKKVKMQRFGSSFNSSKGNGMSQDIPTSGEGWSLK